MLLSSNCISFDNAIICINYHFIFFFNDTATTEIYTLSLHDALPILSTLLAIATVPRDLARSAAPGNLITLLAYGLLGVTGTGMQTTALTMAPASYVNAIRRLSAVLSVVLGRALFGEPDLRRRLVSALLASAGAACLLLAR